MNESLREGKHKLTKCECLVPHENALACRMCSHCKQFIAMEEWGDDCNGPQPPRTIIYKDPKFGDQVLMGYKGSSDYTAGFFHAPYMPFVAPHKDTDIRVRNINTGSDGWMVGYLNPKDDPLQESCYVVYDEGSSWTVIAKRDVIARI